MGYVIKHSTSNVNKARRKGNVAIGVDSSGYDKTSVSGFYAGVPPVEGKHNFVRTAAGGNPNFYSLTDEELINFVNGLGERNLTIKTPSQAGWAGSYSLTDSDTRTFNLTTQQNNAATTSAWRTWYWNVSDYIGSTIAISADVEFVSETNCNWLSMTIGQGNTGQYTTHIAGSDAADRVTINTKPTTPIRMEWSGSINATGIVGFTQWINNVTTNGANAVIKVSNVQIESQDHVTEYSNPDKVVLTPFEALQYLSDREDIIFTDNIATKNIVTDGLVLDLNSRIKSSFRDNLPTENSARVDTWSSTWNNSGTATWNSNDTNVPRFFSDITVHSMVKDTNGNSHLGVGYTTDISEGVECTYSLYVWIPSSNSAGMSGAPPYMRPFPANYNATYLSYNGSTSWGSWPRDQWIRIEGTATPASNANGGISTAYISSYLNTAGDVVYYTAPQFENKSSATPFVSGSRLQNTTIYDLSGYEYTGSINNGPTFNTNGYFEFDATDDEIVINDVGSQLQDFGVTIDMKWNQNSIISSTTFGDIVCPAQLGIRDLGVGPTLYFQLRGSDVQFRWQRASNDANLSPSTPQEANKWNSYTGVLSSTGTTLYKNGNLIGTTSHSKTFLPWYNNTIKLARNAYNNVLDGSISDTKVYNKALTESEIKQNYYGGPIVTDGLIFAVDAGNLVSYESGSTTAYSMTGSLSGSLENGVGYVSTNGGGFTFDGTNDRINLGNPNSLNFGTGNFSISVWFSNTNDSTYNCLYGDYGTGDKWVQITDARRIRCGFRDASNNENDYTTSYYVTDGVIYNVVFLRDGNDNRIYVNGTLINTKTVAGVGSTDSGTNKFIGSLSTVDNHHKGNIYNTYIYDRALSSNEVLQNYNAQKSRFI